MARVNINFEVTDQILDDATVQTLKGKIRSIVQSELDGKHKQLVQDAINNAIENEARKLKSCLSSSWGESEIKSDMRQRLRAKMADLVVSEETLLRQIDAILKPVEREAESCIETIRNKNSMIDKEIERQVRIRIDAMFRTTLIDALMEKSIIQDKGAGDGTVRKGVQGA